MPRAVHSLASVYMSDIMYRMNSAVKNPVRKISDGQSSFDILHKEIFPPSWKLACEVELISQRAAEARAKELQESGRA